jgi:hypothetical protein
VLEKCGSTEIKPGCTYRKKVRLQLQDSHFPATMFLISETAARGQNIENTSEAGAVKKQKKRVERES